LTVENNYHTLIVIERCKSAAKLSSTADNEVMRIPFNAAFNLLFAATAGSMQQRWA
jgi:hypothetical protein